MIVVVVIEADNNNKEAKASMLVDVVELKVLRGGQCRGKKFNVLSFEQSI